MLRKFISESSLPLSEQSEGMWHPESRGRDSTSIMLLSLGVSEPWCRSRPPVRTTTEHMCSCVLSMWTITEHALVLTLV
jgi:hypothetical protein